MLQDNQTKAALEEQDLKNEGDDYKLLNAFEMLWNVDSRTNKVQTGIDKEELLIGE